MINGEMVFKARVGGHQGSGGRRRDPRTNPGTLEHIRRERRKGTKRRCDKELLGRQKEHQEGVVSWEPSDKTISRRKA